VGDEMSAEKEFNRKAAVKCFNATWSYLEKKNRSPEDNRQMLLRAHASRYHWGIVGDPSNLTIGDWQISRVYAELRQAELAILFAKSALDLCEKHKLSDLLASACEGMARAYAITNNSERAREFIKRARAELESVTSDEDKKIYADQIRETEEIIGR
jgi:hypothetical protein